MRNNLFFLIAFLMVEITLNAKTFTTYKRGYWQDSSTWQNREMPGFTFEDTIIIKHKVNIKHNLTLNSGAYMRIDTSGGICGHQLITVYTSALIYKYGNLQIDTMILIGGKVILDGPEETIFSAYASVSGQGASLWVKGAPLRVGPWFECSSGNFESNITSIKNNNWMRVYPNPNQGKMQFYYAYGTPAGKIRITDASSKIVFEKLYEEAVGDIDISNLDNGVYYWEFINGNQINYNGKLVLIH